MIRNLASAVVLLSIVPASANAQTWNSALNCVTNVGEDLPRLSTIWRKETTPEAVTTSLSTRIQFAQSAVPNGERLADVSFQFSDGAQFSALTGRSTTARDEHFLVFSIDEVDPFLDAMRRSLTLHVDFPEGSGVDDLEISLNGSTFALAACR